jgi:hypothetical protein
VTCIIAQPRAVQGRRGIRARQFLEHASDLAIQGVERRPHFGDALAGQILEIARLENVRHAVPDVLCQAGFEIAFQQAREIVHRLIDVLGGGQDFLRRELAVPDDGVQLVGAERPPFIACPCCGRRMAASRSRSSDASR